MTISDIVPCGARGSPFLIIKNGTSPAWGGLAMTVERGYWDDLHDYV
jgi:hypothetical protein